jgi:hypothetical protein
MLHRREIKLATTVLGFSVLLGLVTLGGSVWAAFTAKGSNAGNSVSSAADWDPPTASSSAIGKTQGGIPGFIHQGGIYNVYANVTDSGRPASGIASVTANIATLTTGQTAASLAVGTFPIGVESDNYRTANLTANAVLTAGAYTYSLTSTDKSGHARTQSGYSVTVDNTAPTASDIQTTNKSGNIAGRPEIGDTVIFTFSEQIDPNSVLAGWSGASTNVVTRIDNNALSPDDRLEVYNAADTAQLPLGTVDLGRTDYVSASATFGATGTASAMTQSANTITIVLGTASAGPTTASSTGAMIWSPSASAFDRAANAETLTTKTETGTADKDF